MSKADDEILREARKRFTQCSDWEAVARARFQSDMKFANGDEDNMYQWTAQVTADRQRMNKPCLTVNKTRQHCLQIVNDARQNKPQIQVRPVGDGATFKAAEVFEGIVRHIEYKSNAQAAYDTATWNQVVGGIGYWRVITQYANESTFDQEILIQRIGDPLSVYLDPDIQQYDGSDARFGFIFSDMPRDKFDAAYPKYKDRVGSNVSFADDSFWMSSDHVRIAEYYRKSEKSDRLHYLDNGMTVKRSDIKSQSPGLLDELDARTVKERDIITEEIEWHKICGDMIIEESIFPGKYIPIVRVVGEETVIDGVLDRRGHTRAMLGPQRIYNYMTSSAVESISLSSKAPFTAPIAAIEGYENEWSTCNIINYSVLPYNHMDDAGNPIPAPQRLEGPSTPTAFLEALKLSSDELNAVSGQYEATFGEPSNERSGKAINERQRAANNSTYHYVDHLAQAIRFTGKILIDLIPKIYDTERVMKILALDGGQHVIKIDPNAPAAHQEMPPNTDFDDADENDILAIFNPTVGEYSVEADIGPAWQTKRQELFNAMTMILSQNESLTPIIGDFLFRAADFPLADEIADRMKRLVPPQALGQVDPQVQQLQQQLQQASTLLNQLSQKLHDSESKNLSQSMRTDIDLFNAETKRMEVIGKSDPEVIRAVARTMLTEILAMPANNLLAMQAIEAAQLNAVTKAGK